MSDRTRVKVTVTVASVLVVIGGGLAVAGLTSGHSPAVRPVAEQVRVEAPAVPGDAGGAAAPAVTSTDLLPDSSATPSTSVDPSATPSATPSAGASISPSVSAAAKKTAKPRRTTAAPTTAAPKPKPVPTVPATDGSVVQQVLAHINAARAAEGLPAYALNDNLSKASALHNQLMIGGCGMSHRCPGEADLGDRFSTQGVSWSSAGENIGYGSAGASNTAIIGAANGLTDSMLAEVPPEDGHRKNLLSSGFHRIGLSITRDSKGLVWMTQDFVS